MEYDIQKHCTEYINNLLIELDGCSENYKVRCAVFSSFNHLSVYFPDAYKHMLKVWGIKNENN